MTVCQFAVRRVAAESTAPEHPLPVHKRLGRPRFWKVLGGHGRGVGTKACHRWAQALAPQLQWWGSCQATCSARTPRSDSGLKEPCHGGSLALRVGTWSPSKQVPAPGERSTSAGVLGALKCPITSSQSVYSLSSYKRRCARVYGLNVHFPVFVGTSGPCPRLYFKTLIASGFSTSPESHL